MTCNTPALEFDDDQLETLEATLAEDGYAPRIDPYGDSEDVVILYDRESGSVPEVFIIRDDRPVGRWGWSIPLPDGRVLEYVGHV